MRQDVGLDLLGDRTPLLCVTLLADQLGQLRAAIERHPAHHLRRGEVLRFAAHLPDPAVGFLPVLDRLFDLFLQHRPQLIGDLLARLGMQIHRVEHGAPPNVVLHLVVRAVADPHRARIVVAGQVVQLLFDQLPFAADGVHHLQRMPFTVIGARHVGDEGEEVVRLAVQTEGVEAPPQCERRVTHPGIAVVPVAFALGRLGQRCGRSGQQCAGRRIRQALERQRAALQIGTPRVVGGSHRY